MLTPIALYGALEFILGGIFMGVGLEHGIGWAVVVGVVSLIPRSHAQWLAKRATLRAASRDAS